MAEQFDYYQIFGLTPATITPENLKEIRNTIAKRFHADVSDLKSTDAAEAYLKRVNEAYSVLSDPAKRAVYDRLREQSQQTREQSAVQHTEQSGRGAATTQETVHTTPLSQEQQQAVATQAERGQKFDEWVKAHQQLTETEQVQRLEQLVADQRARNAEMDAFIATHTPKLEPRAELNTPFSTQREGMQRGAMEAPGRPSTAEAPQQAINPVGSEGGVGGAIG